LGFGSCKQPARAATGATSAIVGTGSFGSRTCSRIRYDSVTQSYAYAGPGTTLVPGRGGVARPVRGGERQGSGGASERSLFCFGN
jgi:hypothetical protein